MFFFMARSASLDMTILSVRSLRNCQYGSSAGAGLSSRLIDVLALGVPLFGGGVFLRSSQICCFSAARRLDLAQVPAHQ